MSHRLRGLLFAAMAVVAAGLGLVVVHSLSLEVPHAAEQLVQSESVVFVEGAPDVECDQSCVNSPFNEDALIACVLGLLAIGLMVSAGPMVLASRPPGRFPIVASHLIRAAGPSLIGLSVRRI